MADVKQMRRLFQSSHVKFAFGQHVCELMFGVDVPNLNLGIQINPVKQPIKSISVGSCLMSHSCTPAFDDQLNDGFIVLKDFQHSTKSTLLRSTLSCWVGTLVLVLGVLV